jgi:hypothetical protein
MYYSWFNITSAYGNNTFSMYWNGGATELVLTLPDGLYEVATINQYFQFYCIANGYYLIAPSGQYVYFAEFVVNESQYKVDVNTFYVPTSAYFTATLAPLGYTVPANWLVGYYAVTPASLPSSPTISIPPLGLGNILGFNFPTNTPYLIQETTLNGTALSSSRTVGSVSSPNLQPNSSVLISSSMIDNPYTTPTSIIYSITPSVAVGEIISEKPPSFMWNKLIDGVYNQLRITLLGTDLAPLKIQDGAITIILALADEDEVKTK